MCYFGYVLPVILYLARAHTGQRAHCAHYPKCLTELSLIISVSLVSWSLVSLSLVSLSFDSIWCLYCRLCLSLVPLLSLVSLFFLGSLLCFVSLLYLFVSCVSCMQYRVGPDIRFNGYPSAG